MSEEIDIPTTVADPEEGSLLVTKPKRKIIIDEDEEEYIESESELQDEEEEEEEDIDEEEEEPSPPKKTTTKPKAPSKTTTKSKIKTTKPNTKGKNIYVTKPKTVAKVETKLTVIPIKKLKQQYVSDSAERDRSESLKLYQLRTALIKQFEEANVENPRLYARLLANKYMTGVVYNDEIEAKLAEIISLIQLED